MPGTDKKNLGAMFYTYCINSKTSYVDWAAQRGKVCRSAEDILYFRYKALALPGIMRKWSIKTAVFPLPCKNRPYKIAALNFNVDHLRT